MPLSEPANKENIVGLTWWFPPWSVWTGPWRDFWRCCSPSTETDIRFCFTEKYVCFPSYPFQNLKSHGAVMVLQRRDVVVAKSQFSSCIYLENIYQQNTTDQKDLSSEVKGSQVQLPGRRCCTPCGPGHGTLPRSAWSAGQWRPFYSSSQSTRSDHTSGQRGHQNMMSTRNEPLVLTWI